MESHKNITSLLEFINVSQYRKSSEFHILKFEDHLDEIPHRTIARKCDFFQIYFSKEYDAKITVDDVSFSAKDKTLISFLAPMQTLSVDVKSIGNLANGYMLLFSSSFFKNAISDFDIQKKYPYFNQNYLPFYTLEKNRSIFKELFDKIYLLFQDFNVENEEIIQSYLTILLLEAKKSFFNGEITNNIQSREQQIAFSFESLIREYADARHPIKFYAEKLNISTVYLSECVKKATNKTAKKILNEYEVLEASSLLIQSTKTVDEIADLMGFSATSNFINFFKRYTSLSPSQYRNRHKT